MKKLTTILSIDGGGIRGIIPGMILKSLEEKLQKKTNNPDARLADYFELMAGTSTGGILTCAYLTPSATEPKKPKFTAEEAVDLYLEHGREIFALTFKKKLFSLAGTIKSKFDHQPLEKTLEKYFGEAKLSELLRPCLIPSYDIRRRNAHFFCRHKADNDAYNFYLKDVARSTSAAPTYFEPERVYSMSGTPYPLVDGGLFANNPALCAYSEARQIFKKSGEPDKCITASDMFIVSVGTGQINKSYPYDAAKNWGAVKWIQPVIDIMMSGVSDTVAFQLKQIYDAVGLPGQYVRFNPKLERANPDMDDASEKNLQALKEAGAYNADVCDAELERISDVLIENKREAVPV